MRSKVREHHWKATKVLGDLWQPTAPSASSSVSSSSSAVHLPKVELPKFSGNVIEWTSFWDKFKEAVDHCDLPAVGKFTYLQSLLEGDAKATIQGLSVTENQYTEAIDLLEIAEKHFGCRKPIIYAHVPALLNIPVP